MSKLRFTLFATAGAAAMLLAPLALLPATNLPAGYAALAGNGNGNGNGGGNGNGNGNSNGGSDTESHGNSDNSAKHEEKAAAHEEAKAAKAEAKADKPKNLNAELGRLKSLNRNINGLMNSSDPHMAGIRDYVKANAALDAAEARLVDAQGKLDAAQTAYDAVVTAANPVAYDGTPYADTSPATLQARLDLLQSAPITDETSADYAAFTAEVAALETILGSDEATNLGLASDAVAEAEVNVTNATVGTTDADLEAALVAAANKPGAITPEILAWAKAKLGTE